jgi:hypothetical protein
MNAATKLLYEVFVELLIMELVQQEKWLITKWDEISESIETREQRLKNYLYLLPQQRLSKSPTPIQPLKTKNLFDFLNCISHFVVVLKDWNIIYLHYLLFQKNNSSRENVYKQYLATRASYFVATIRKFMRKMQSPTTAYIHNCRNAYCRRVNTSIR